MEGQEIYVTLRQNEATVVVEEYSVSAETGASDLTAVVEQDQAVQVQVSHD